MEEYGKIIFFISYVIIMEVGVYLETKYTCPNNCEVNHLHRGKSKQYTERIHLDIPRDSTFFNVLDSTLR